MKKINNKKNFKYENAIIQSLNNDIKKKFPHVARIQANFKCTLDGFQRLVMLDRYSQKDESNETLKIGDTVITVVSDDNIFPVRGIGNVTNIHKSKITIQLEPPYQSCGKKIIICDQDHVNKPLELYWEQISQRVSNSLASVEDTSIDKKIYQEKFYEQLKNFKIIPAGRVLYGAGSKNIVTLYNCFVMPLIQDSRKGISEHRKEVMEIMSRGGGVGTNGSTLRPRTTIAKTVGGKSSGAVSWLNDIANLTNLVEQGGSRRGAQMIMLADWHPDIIEFIISKMQKVDILKVLRDQAENHDIRVQAGKKLKKNVKNNSIIELCNELQELGDTKIPEGVLELVSQIRSETHECAVVKPDFLSGANISVTITHDFMKAVKQNQNWKLRFPDLANYTKEEKEFYDTHWRECGDIREWEKMGYKVRTYKTIKARHLWELIIFCATFSAEPGIFFIDTANDFANAKGYSQSIVATNPCGEQPLAPYSVCNLAAINLAQFVDKEKCIVQKKQLIESVKTCVRLQDNVVDLTHYFLSKNSIQAKGERRVGLGIMGLHDMLIYCKKRYGSKAGNQLTSQVMKIIAISAYEASIEIAKQKKQFPFLQDREKFIKSKFIQSLPRHIQEDIVKYGIRNSHLLTIAPTGTTGTMVNVSTGLEPYFAFDYHRSGRLGQKVSIKTPIIKEMGELHPDMTQEEKEHLFVASQELSPEEHTNVQIAIQRWIDSSISKTVNAPSNFKVEQVGAIYMKLYDNDAKGGTVYVDGSRSEQVLNIKGETLKTNNQTRLQNLTFISDIKDNNEEWKIFRSDRANREIGPEIENTCPQCKEGVMRKHAGCVQCDNCNWTSKCDA